MNSISKATDSPLIQAIKRLSSAKQRRADPKIIAILEAKVVDESSKAKAT